MFPSLACLWCFIPQETKGRIKEKFQQSVQPAVSAARLINHCQCVKTIYDLLKRVTFWDHISALTVSISCSLPLLRPDNLTPVFSGTAFPPGLLWSCTIHGPDPGLTVSVSLCELVNHLTAVLSPYLFFCICGMSISASPLLTLITRRHTCPHIAGIIWMYIYKDNCIHRGTTGYKYSTMYSYIFT